MKKCKHGIPVQADCYICGLESDYETFREALVYCADEELYNAGNSGRKKASKVAREALRKVTKR